MCCRPLITSKFLASELPFHGWKRPEIAWREIWTVWLMFWWGSTDQLFPSRTQNSIQISPHAISGLFNHEKEAPRQGISKWSTIYSTFSRSGWSVVRSASLAKRITSKKRPSPHLHKVPTRSNKVSPRTLQTALVFTQLLKKFPAFYGTRRFITIFTTARHWSLSWARRIQSTSSHTVSPRFVLILSSKLCLGLPSGLASYYL
jgi:hypothetical protein